MSHLVAPARALHHCEFCGSETEDGRHDDCPSQRFIRVQGLLPQDVTIKGVADTLEDLVVEMRDLANFGWEVNRYEDGYLHLVFREATGQRNPVS